ncbi:MAG: TRAP transporter small permease [Dehalobacterium sp.]
MKFAKIWDIIEEFLSGLFFMIGITLIFYGVIMRYIFNMPSIWIDEFSVYFIIWGTVIGWSIAERDERHIRVNIIYDKCNLKTQHLFTIISNIIGILFCVFLAYAAYILEADYIKTMQRSINAALPLWIVYLFFPFASLSLGVRYVQGLILVLSNGGKDWYAARECDKTVDNIVQGGF